MPSVTTASPKAKLAHRSSKCDSVIVKKDASEGFLGGFFLFAKGLLRF